MCTVTRSNLHWRDYSCATKEKIMLNDTCWVTTGCTVEATSIKRARNWNTSEDGVESHCLKTALRTRSIPRRLPLNSEMWTEVNAKDTFHSLPVFREKKRVTEIRPNNGGVIVRRSSSLSENRALIRIALKFRSLVFGIIKIEIRYRGLCRHRNFSH